MADERNQGILFTDDGREPFETRMARQQELHALYDGSRRRAATARITEMLERSKRYEEDKLLVMQYEMAALLGSVSLYETISII